MRIKSRESLWKGGRISDVDENVPGKGLLVREAIS
jgi:hypothetical protein